ncbi:hypothetical protein [Streptomyces canus]|uniref:hypothetical protein n=1 Tax=Streptomyces canus TaxID=58343 RepID=UPI003822AEF8
MLPELQTLRVDVMKHARAEERYEFNHIRRHADQARLASMATALKAAENRVLGPGALVDRTRDAVRKAMGKDG